MTYMPPGSIPPNPGLPSPRRRAPWLWIALAIAIVIIVVLSVLLMTQGGNDTAGEPTAAAPTQTSAVPSAPAPGTSGTDSSMNCDGFTASVDATSQPGWRATINRYKLAYAAPPDWTVAACGVRTGWAQPCPQGQCAIRELGAVATVPNPACPKQNLAVAGVTGSKNPDIRVALDEESATVSAIYTRDGMTPTVEYSPVREFSIGPHPAVQTVATVTNIVPGNCTGASAYHSIVVTTVPQIEGSVVFVISLREGTTVKANPDVINQMVNTLRSPAQ